MCDHDQGLVVTLTEGLYHILHQSTVRVVETMEWLVENQQLWVFDEGTSQKD
jgi:hypothetical protein